MGEGLSPASSGMAVFVDLSWKRPHPFFEEWIGMEYGMMVEWEEGRERELGLVCKMIKGLF